MSSLKLVHITAATLLALGKTGREVAKELTCTPETVSTWKRHPAFAALLNQLKQDMLEAARETLRTGLRDAVIGLTDLSRFAKSEDVRRKACVDVIKLAGLQEPQTGAAYWGIGSTDEEELEEQQAERELRRQQRRG